VRVSDDGLAKLSEELAKLKSLSSVTLNFRGNEITSDKGLITLSGALSELNNLEFLRLDFRWRKRFDTKQEIFDEGLKVLNDTLASLKNLKKIILEFDWNDKNRKEVLEMFKNTFSNMKNITSFESFLINDLQLTVRLQ